MTRRMKIVAAGLAITLLSLGAVALSGEQYEYEAAETTIQYRLVPLPYLATQPQLQSILTTQGNAGWRLIGPYVVGPFSVTSPKQVLVFSKP